MTGFWKSISCITNNWSTNLDISIANDIDI